MSRIKRFIQKDRYCIVRCGVVLGVLILMSMLVLIHVTQRSDISGKAERASEAAVQVAAQFNQMTESSMMLLEGSAGMLDAQQADTEALLSSLTYAGNFEEAWISAGDAANEYGISVVQDGESLSMSTPLKSGGVLNARLNAEAINAILGGAFAGDYGFIIYNSETGAYLINTTQFNGGSYYDALMRLNNDGAAEDLLVLDEAEMHIRRSKSDGGDFYIAQRETNLQPWSISLVIPTALLDENSGSAGSLTVLIVAFAAVMLAFLALATLLMLCRVRRADRNHVHAMDAAEKLLHIAARDAGISLLVCSRGNGNVVARFDGMGLLTNEQSIANFADLERICGMESGELDRIYRCMGELEDGGSREIIVHCFASDHEERALRFGFHAAAEDEKSIVCTIRDCTQQQESEDRAKQESSFLESVRSKSSTICQINISRNRWTVLHAKNPENMRILGANLNSWQDYTAYLTGQLREYIHPADYDQYAESMSIAGIAAAFRAGHEDFTRDYRVKSVRSGNFEWHRMRTRIWLDAKTNDIIANLCVFNVDAKKNAELERGERKKVLQQALMALGGIYNGLYYVDLENDLAYTARSAGGDLASRLSMPYKATFESYIENNVHPENREAMRHMLNAYFLRRSMMEGSHFQKMEYRRRIDEDGFADALIIVQPARFENGSVKEVVIAIRHLDR